MATETNANAPPALQGAGHAQAPAGSGFAVPQEPRTEDMFNLRRLSFGTPAAIVTSMALIVGLDAATASRATVVGSLLIAGLADNLTDSLSVHIYQESERLAERQAFQTTLTNFLARLVVALSFVVLFLILPTTIAIFTCVVWGFFLLSGLSYLLAKARHVKELPEIFKHAAVAIVVIATSEAIGLAIQTMLGCV